MENLVLIGAPNIDLMQIPWSVGGSILAAGSEASADFAIENVVSSEPSETWRSTTASASAKLLYSNTYFYQEMAYPPSTGAFSVDSVAIVNHNLVSGSGYYRICGLKPADSSGFTAENVLPNAIAASTNLSGAVTDIDEGTTVDGAKIGPTTASSDWTARVQFATPSTTPLTGAYKQQFWAFVFGAGYSGSSFKDITIKAELYENGVLVRDLGTKLVSESAGQWLIWTWNASELGTADGSLVECKLTGTSAYSGLYYVEVDSLLWRCETALNANSVLDSGWVAYTEPSFGNVYPLEAGYPKSSLYQWGSAANVNDLYFYFMDDQSPTGLTAASPNLLPAAPSGYVEVGSVFAGVGWSPTTNRSFGPLLRTVPLTQVQQTHGGQIYGSNLPTLRELPIPMDWLTTLEGGALIDRLVLRKGQLRPIFVAILPDDSNLNQLTAFPAVVSGGVEMGYNHSSNYPTSMNITLREKR